MPYELNPHHLVRIWFSKHPNLAINYQNKRRLIQLRAQNPQATIYLVYAKKLLSELALDNLYVFCKKIKVNLLSMEEDILPLCKEEEEKQLILFYEKEIEALHQGGNLAAASDIARWLSPVYSRGIYSDFDTQIHLQGLPEKITLDAPILLNMGSLQQKGFDTVILCNDLIAVAGNYEETINKIKAIQQGICKAYCNPQVYLEFFTQFAKDLSEFLTKTASPEESQKEVEHFLQTNPEVQIAKRLGERSVGPIELRKIIEKKAEKLGEHFDSFYKQTVIHITGPNNILLNLFKRVNHMDEIVTIKPYSFSHYPLLASAISSCNSFPFHMSVDAFTKSVASPENDSDVSWLPTSEKIIAEKERTMAATQIQRFFRACKAKSSPSPASSFFNEEKVDIEESDKPDNSR